MDHSELLKLTGQNNTTPQEFLPELRFNTDEDIGKVGTLYVNKRNEDNYKPVFMDSVTFIPFVNKIQFQRYDPIKEKIVAKSQLVSSMFDSAIDTDGGTRCGYVTKKKREGLPADVIANQQHIKIISKVYGKVLLGDEWVDVIMRNSKSSLIAVGDAVDSVTKKNMLLPQFKWTITGERRKTGNTKYYVPVISIDFKNPIKIDDNIIAALNKFNENINAENTYVGNQWKAKQKGVLTAEDKEVSSVLSELGFQDDEIPSFEKAA